MSRTNHHENTSLFRRPASPGFDVSYTEVFFISGSSPAKLCTFLFHNTKVLVSSFKMNLHSGIPAYYIGMAGLRPPHPLTRLPGAADAAKFKFSNCFSSFPNPEWRVAATSETGLRRFSPSVSDRVNEILTDAAILLNSSDVKLRHTAASVFYEITPTEGGCPCRMYFGNGASVFFSLLMSVLPHSSAR